MAALGVPPRVAAAQALARRLGFEHSCSAATGRILRLLAASKPAGRMLEIGTGTGVGTAWLEAGMASTAQLWTVEIDEERARAARELFHDARGVQVVHADWRAMLALGPFDLVFVDGGKAKQQEPAAIVEALRPGGMAVIDDMTPPEHWPPQWTGRPDPVRDYWLKRDARLVAVEVLETADRAVLLAVRRAD